MDQGRGEEKPHIRPEGRADPEAEVDDSLYVIETMGGVFTLIERPHPLNKDRESL